MSTDTIGSAGRNFANLADWFAAIPATLLEDEIGEVYNDSLFTMTATMDFTGKTPGAFSITLRPATGQGFADSAGVGGFKLDFNQAQGAAFSSTSGYIRPLIQLRQAKMTVQGLQFRTTTSNSGVWNQQAASTIITKNCILDSNRSDGAGDVAGVSDGSTMINCLVINRAASAAPSNVVVAYGSVCINVTAVRPSGLAAAAIGFREAGGTTNVVKNCCAFNFTTPFTATGWDAASNYNCSSDANAPGANSQQSKTYANQFVSTTDDWRPKAGSDLLLHGNTDATNAPADILGVTRGVGTLGTIGAAESVPGGAAAPAPNQTEAVTVAESLTPNLINMPRAFN